LQLLDEERRNQRLIQAVATTSEYIISNFDRMITNLGEQVSSAIYKIGADIANSIYLMVASISGAIGTMSSEVGSINNMSANLSSSIGDVKKAVNWSTMRSTGEVVDDISYLIS